MDILKMYDKSTQMGFQENPNIDIGKRKSSSKVVNLLKRMDRHKEDILKFLFATGLTPLKTRQFCNFNLRRQNYGTRKQN
jgi:hypothetical protein